MGMQDRYRLAVKTMKNLFADPSKDVRTIDYYEALARSVQCNLDYRLKIVNTALQAGQLEVAAFAMFPALNVSSTLYTRSNDYSVSGITAQGTTTGLSSSTPRTLLTSRNAISWNLLDFGMGYVKAKQQTDRVLIAAEESRRQLQELAQDVLASYWVAYSAQTLLEETREFQRLLTQSKQKLDRALQDKSVPKENLLNYQAAILDGNRKLLQLQYKYDKAMLDLKHLMFLPADQKIVLAPPPRVLFQTHDLSNLNIAKMDAVTLVYHPQLQGQHYQERIAEFGLSTVLLQALPGITLNYGQNYDSNQFLLNNRWLDKSIDVAWNLLNLASLPANYKTAKAQVQYENIKSMAMTMAALTETRYAYTHYQTLRQEYFIAQKQTANAKAIYKLNQDRKLASIASDQQVILAKLKVIASKMDEDLLLSDLSVALGQLYLSVGVDMVPEIVMTKPLPEAKAILKAQLEKSENFSTYINRTYADVFKQLPVLTKKKAGYTIQFYASRDLKSAERMRNTMPCKDSLAIAKVASHDNSWYIITYGKYDSQQNAYEQLKRLPRELTAYSPWVRRVACMSLVSQVNLALLKSQHHISLDNKARVTLTRTDGKQTMSMSMQQLIL